MQSIASRTEGVLIVPYREAMENTQDKTVKAAFEAKYQKKAALLQQQNKAYNQYCEDTGLKKQSDRVTISKWDRSQAAKATAAAKKYNLGSIDQKQNATTVNNTSAQPKPKATVISTPVAEKQRYADVTQELRDTATPNSHIVEEAQEVTVKGVTYKVDGHNVVLDYSSHEKEIAELLEKEFGGEIKMLPRVNNPQGVSTPDYLFRGEGYDLKTIGETTGKNPLLNRIKKAKAQSKNSVFDVSSSNLSENEIVKQIAKTFKDKEASFANKIIIVKNGKVMYVFKRT